MSFTCDWKVYRRAAFGEKEAFVCPSTEDPWDLFGIPRNVSLTYSATLEGCTLDKAEAVVKVMWPDEVSSFAEYRDRLEEWIEQRS